MNGDGTCIKLWSYADAPQRLRNAVRSINERMALDADFYMLVPGAAIAGWFNGKPTFHNSWTATADIIKRIAGNDVAWFEAVEDGNALCVGRLR